MSGGSFLNPHVRALQRPEVGAQARRLKNRATRGAIESIEQRAFLWYDRLVAALAAASYRSVGQSDYFELFHHDEYVVVAPNPQSIDIKML
jgi:hypothetical protein